MLYGWVKSATSDQTAELIITSVSIAWLSLAFALFLVARGLLGGTPITTRAHAITTDAPEIVSYALAQAIGIGCITLMNHALFPTYVTLRHSDHQSLATIIALLLSLGIMAIVYKLFTHIRRAFLGAKLLAVFAGYCVVAGLLVLYRFGLTPFGMLLLMLLLLFGIIIGAGIEAHEKRKARLRTSVKLD